MKTSLAVATWSALSLLVGTHVYAAAPDGMSGSGMQMQNGTTKQDMGDMPMMDRSSSHESYSATGKVLDIKRKSVAISQRAPATSQVVALTIAHDPVQALNWPQMTMEFEVDSQELARGINKGDAVRFQFTKRDGRHVITDVHKTGH